MVTNQFSATPVTEVYFPENKKLDYITSGFGAQSRDRPLLPRHPLKNGHTLKGLTE